MTLPLISLRRRVADRLGFRGLFLVLFGSMFTFIGLAIPYGNNRPSSPTLPSTDPLLFHLSIPMPISMAIWITPGLAAAVLACFPNVTRRDQRGAVRQVVAFVGLFIPPAIRFASNFTAFWSVVTDYWWGVQPFWASVGEALALAAKYVPASALYFLVATSVVLFAAWPEPTVIADESDVTPA